VEGEIIFSFKGVWSRTFTVQKEIIRKGESHKQDHKETQPHQATIRIKHHQKH